MNQTWHVVGAVAEIFTWVGLGAAALLCGVALILSLADGTWLPAQAVVEPVEDGRVARWIDDEGGVNEAPLSPHDQLQLGERDMADIYYRRGWRNRMRLTRGSPAVRAMLLLAAGLFGLGVVAFAVGWVLLAIGL